MTIDQWLKENGYGPVDRTCGTCENFYPEYKGAPLGDCLLLNKELKIKSSTIEVEKVCNNWKRNTGKKLDFEKWQKDNGAEDAPVCGKCKHFKADLELKSFGQCKLALKEIDTDRAEVYSNDYCNRFDEKTRKKKK